jgi:hypothetical protein
VSAPRPPLAAAETPLKDDRLAAIARDHNVAQFVSLGPGPDPRVRHHRLRGEGLDAGADAATAVAALLDRAPDGVNVRTFRPDHPKGNPFDYGLRTPADALALVRRRAAEGYHVIVNETLDVDDGGVSGVLLAGVAELAPGDTPRAVERPGVAALPRPLAERLVEVVYGFRPDWPDDTGRRVELSVHPVPVGHRGERGVIWEVEDVVTGRPGTPMWGSVGGKGIAWPNRLSRMLGDKAFGLLLAHLLGRRVPSSLVVARAVTPFRFGEPTGSGRVWTRTCPREPEAGRYPTLPRWTDPFRLLQEADPGGERLASLLVQDGVRARHSGAAARDPATGTSVVEAVAGTGDAFMLGHAPAAAPPDAVAARVHAELAALAGVLGGGVRLEWADDGDRLWVLQLHRTRAAMAPGVFNAGDPPGGWLPFAPADGLDVLRTLLGRARAEGKGVLVTAPVGVTSHVGDLIRAAGVPGRLDTPGGTEADDTPRHRSP